MQAPVRVRADRPITIPDPDVRKGVIYLSVHDDWYLRERQRLREAKHAAHPDKGGNDLRFHRATKALTAFEAEEATWYAQHGLQPPPSPSRAPAPPVDGLLARLPSCSGRPPSKRVAARAYLDAHPDATNQMLADALGISLENACSLRSRVKSTQSGEARNTILRRVLQVLADGEPHTGVELRGLLGGRYSPSVFVSRLRAKGFDVRTEYPYQTGRPRATYRLVHPEAGPAHG